MPAAVQSAAVQEQPRQRDGIAVVASRSDCARAGGDALGILAVEAELCIRHRLVGGCQPGGKQQRRAGVQKNVQDRSHVSNPSCSSESSPTAYILAVLGFLDNGLWQ